MSVFMQPIYTQTITSQTTNAILFSNIPQGYTDLKIVVSARSTAAVTASGGGFNFWSNDGFVGAMGNKVEGNGAGAYAQKFATIVVPGANATANTFSNTEVYLLNYSGGNNKQAILEGVSENNGTEAFQGISAELVPSNQPITVAGFSIYSGNLAPGTTATLYGISSKYAGQAPGAPTNVTVTDQAQFASIAFTPASNDQSQVYKVTNTTNNVASYGQFSPITAPATLNTATTYTVSAVNDKGTGTSTASSPITTANSYASIATSTITGSPTQIIFTNIPQHYKHLQIRGRSRGAASTADAVLGYQLNVDSSGSYGFGWHVLAGNGSSAFAGNGGGSGYPTTYSTYTPGTSVTANYWGVSVADILDYSSTSKFKTIKAIGGFDANGSGNVGIGSGLWMKFEPVASVTVILANDPYTVAVGSTFALYGIA
jgi:hypothetical protein